MQLPRLIGVEEWAELRDAYLEKRPLIHASTNDERRFEHLWAEWELDAICRFTPAPQYEEFRLVSRFKTVPRSAYFDRLGVFREEAFRQLRAGGASLALGNFSSFSDRALALSRHLEAEFRCPVQVNLYVTPAGHQGLGAHVDPHDVLVLQIYGKKSWDVYDGADASSNKAETTLERGGWLYLPKGTRHEVRNRGEETSVHFTVGFHPLTWGEVFQRALAGARVATRELNAAIAVDGDLAASRDQLLARLQTILPFTDVAAVRQKYYADFPALGMEVPRLTLEVGEGAPDASDHSVLAWNSEATLSPNSTLTCDIGLPYRRFPLTLRHDLRDTVSWMQSARRFSPNELPIPSRPDALLLCRFLVSNGILLLVSSP